MNLKIYLRRAVKSIVYFAVIFFLVYLLIYLVSDKTDPNASFFDTMIPGRQKQITMLAFIVVFGLIYPFIAYIRKEAYLSKSFDENRDIIMKVFDAANYKLIDEKDNKLFFRPESKLIRFMRMMEDAVIVDYSGNPLILSGMRKEIYRLAKHVEYMSSRQNEII